LGSGSHLYRYVNHPGRPRLAVDRGFVGKCTDEDGTGGTGEEVEKPAFSDQPTAFSENKGCASIRWFDEGSMAIPF
jgi:hypothetical protein